MLMPSGMMCVWACVCESIPRDESKSAGYSKIAGPSQHVLFISSVSSKPSTGTNNQLLISDTAAAIGFQHGALHSCLLNTNPYSSMCSVIHLVH